MGTQNRRTYSCLYATIAGYPAAMQRTVRIEDYAMLGDLETANVPPAFSLVGLVNAALRLSVHRLIAQE